MWIDLYFLILSSAIYQPDRIFRVCIPWKDIHLDLCDFKTQSNKHAFIMFFSKETPVHVLALDILTEFVESTVIFLNTPMNVCQKVSTLWQYQQTTWQRMNKTHGGIVNLSLIPVTEVQVSYLKLQVRYISNYQNTCFVLKILNRVLFIFFFFLMFYYIYIYQNNKFIYNKQT